MKYSKTHTNELRAVLPLFRAWDDMMQQFGTWEDRQACLKRLMTGTAKYGLGAYRNRDLVTDAREELYDAANYTTMLGALPKGETEGQRFFRTQLLKRICEALVLLKNYEENVEYQEASGSGAAEAKFAQAQQVVAGEGVARDDGRGAGGGVVAQRRETPETRGVYDG